MILKPRPRYSLPSATEFRVMLYLLYAIVTAVLVIGIAPKLAHPAMLSSLLLAALLGLIVGAAVIFRRSRDLAEPLYWFSLMYYLLVPGTIYFLLTGFDSSEHLLAFSLSETISLTNAALGLFVIGYLGFIVGYFAVADRCRPRMVRFPTESQFSDWVARVVIGIAIAVGIANFVYIIVSYPGGALGYLLNFGLRSYRFEQIGQSVSTFGYQFLYAGVFLWFLIMLRSNKMNLRHGEFWLFLIALFLSILVSISQGRMSQTVTYLLILSFIGYTLAPTGQSNLKSIAWTAAVAIFGIVLYFYRKVSIALYTGKAPFGATEFWQDLAYWIVDKGNIPNLPVVMNLLADQGINGEFWFGKSYAFALASTLGIWGETTNVGQRLGALWFGQSGGLPPTVVGEAYVNFGVIGVPLVLMLLGIGCALFYQRVKLRGSFIWFIVYFAILFKFIFILPKGETANFVAAFWQFLPTVLLYLLISAVSGAMSTSSLKRKRS